MGDLIGNNDGSTNSPCRLQTSGNSSFTGFHDFKLVLSRINQSKTINHVSSVLPRLNFCVCCIGFKSISHSTEHVTHTVGYYSNIQVDLQPKCQCNVKRNICQVKSCRNMSCNAGFYRCQSQGISKCYNHCLSTFVHPWFIQTNWWILADHGSNHIVILIDFLHPPVTWNLFPVAI